MVYDLVIIGAGPAGLSAGIYAKRAMLKTIIIEKAHLSGGQVINTYEVDNYLGFPKIDGYELSQKFREHADLLETEFLRDEVLQIENEGNLKKVFLKNNGTVRAKTIIIASGAEHRKLNIIGEKELAGKGVSYCAACDGAFFKGKATAVVGGGDTAAEDALFLARLCRQVYLIHRRDELKSAKILQDKLMKTENVKIIFDTVVKKINGSENVTDIVVENVKTENKENIFVDGIFIAVGISPLSKVFENLVKMDESGYIIAAENGVTSANGIFAAGDVRTKNFRQIITSAADGANCVYSVEKYLNSL